MTGKDLKAKLELIGISLRQVAEVLGISEQNLQNKLSAADIKVSFLCKLSLELHKSIYFFLDGQEFYQEETFSVSPSDSSLALRLMDKLDEKDQEIKVLNEKLLATSMTLGECRLKEEVVALKNAISPVLTANTNLPLSSSTNAISVDVP